MRDGDEAGAARVHCPRLGFGSEGRVQVCSVAAPGISGTERDRANGGRETERQREWGWVHVASILSSDEVSNLGGLHQLILASVGYGDIYIVHIPAGGIIWV